MEQPDVTRPPKKSNPEGCDKAVHKEKIITTRHYQPLAKQTKCGAVQNTLPSSPRQGIGEDVIGPLFVPDFNIVPLNEQRPTHKALVVVVHAIQKN